MFTLWTAFVISVVECERDRTKSDNLLLIVGAITIDVITILYIL